MAYDHVISRRRIAPMRGSCGLHKQRLGSLGGETMRNKLRMLNHPKVSSCLFQCLLTKNQLKDLHEKMRCFLKIDWNIAMQSAVSCP